MPSIVGLGVARCGRCHGTRSWGPNRLAITSPVCCGLPPVSVSVVPVLLYVRPRHVLDLGIRFRSERFRFGSRNLVRSRIRIGLGRPASLVLDHRPVRCDPVPRRTLAPVARHISCCPCRSYFRRLRVHLGKRAGRSAQPPPRPPLGSSLSLRRHPLTMHHTPAPFLGALLAHPVSYSPARRLNVPCATPLTLSPRRTRGALHPVGSRMAGAGDRFRHVGPLAA